MLDISSRINKIIEHKSLSINQFEKKIDVSNNSIGAAIRRKSEFKSDVLNKILKQFTEINPIWLLTGKGEMITETSNKKELSDFNPEEIISYVYKNRKTFEKEAIFQLFKDKLTSEGVKEEMSRREKAISLELEKYKEILKSKGFDL